MEEGRGPDVDDRGATARTGMILGKFMPPHLGHHYLVDFARHYCRDLTVIVGTLETEPIDGKLRFEWMRRLFPDVRVLHLTDDLPQQPSDHPEFWTLWHDAIRRLLPEGPDYVFASEDYGFKLAEILGAEYVPVDHARELVPVSGTAIREQPMENWRYLPPCVRPYFVRRVCIFGPESTGKTTLTRDLARHYDTVWVGEYARPLLELKGDCDAEDIPRIARGQIASEEALATQANRVMFCDTDLITTTIWSEVLFGSCPEWIARQADRRDYDLYLLTDVDVPWVDDPLRYLPDQDDRRAFFDRCERELQSRNRRYVKVSGSWQQRFETACRAVDELLRVPQIR